MKQLEVFVAVAEEQHFGDAALRLHMTQPPLSRQIQLLEKDLGSPLFHRGARQTTLTPAGELFLPSAYAILDRCLRARSEVKNLTEGSTGTLHIGYTAVASQAVLPGLLRELKEVLPRVKVVLREDVSAEQARLLERAEIDLAVLRLPAPLHAAQTALLKSDKLMVALPTQHRLAARPDIRMDELQGEDFIMYSPLNAQYFHDLVSRLTVAENVSLKSTQSAEQVQALLSFVAGGLGVGLVPSATADWTSPSVTLKPLVLSAGAEQLNRIEHHLAWNPASRNPLVEMATRALASFNKHQS
ncbi:LysR family transcriptional regulator [Glutamicibacter sp. NPDC087344]|uniref:LysR family transcriptional regulator n=1 Tax=Glutamicibacter sp. NPDC087344 TaxID=3363994 RepID=UPI0037F13D8B